MKQSYNIIKVVLLGLATVFFSTTVFSNSILEATDFDIQSYSLKGNTDGLISVELSDISSPLELFGVGRELLDQSGQATIQNTLEYSFIFQDKTIALYRFGEFIQTVGQQKDFSTLSIERKGKILYLKADKAILYKAGIDKKADLFFHHSKGFGLVEQKGVESQSEEAMAKDEKSGAKLRILQHVLTTNKNGTVQASIDVAQEPMVFGAVSRDELFPSSINEDDLIPRLNYAFVLKGGRITWYENGIKVKDLSTYKSDTRFKLERKETSLHAYVNDNLVFQVEISFEKSLNFVLTNTLKPELLDGFEEDIRYQVLKIGEEDGAAESFLVDYGAEEHFFGWVLDEDLPQDSEIGGIVEQCQTGLYMKGDELAVFEKGGLVLKGIPYTKTSKIMLIKSEDFVVVTIDNTILTSVKIEAKQAISVVAGYTLSLAAKKVEEAIKEVQNFGPSVRVSPWYGESDKNWISTINYDYNLLGSPSWFPPQYYTAEHSRTYFDDLGRTTQQHVVDREHGQIITTETAYDALGRPVLSTLPAPSTVGSLIFYKDKFLTNANEEAYDYTNFDLDTNIDSPDPVGTDAGVEVLTLNPYTSWVQPRYSVGWYYSNNNSMEAYVPTTDYPYSRVEYSPEGGIKRMSGVGDHHHLGSGNETRSFSLSMTDELRYLYGSGRSYELEELDEAPVTGSANAVLVGENPLDAEVKGIPQDIKAFKSVVIGADGIEQVTYTSASGLVLATCVSGKSEPGVIWEGANNSPRIARYRIGYNNSMPVNIHLPEDKANTLEAKIPISYGTTPLNPTPSPVEFDDVVFTITDLDTYSTLDEGIDYTVTSVDNGTKATFQFIGNYAGKSLFLKIKVEIGVFGNPLIGDLVLSHELDYTHWTLNYYNKWGELRRTVAPNGIDYLADVSDPTTILFEGLPVSVPGGTANWPSLTNIYTNTPAEAAPPRIGEDIWSYNPIENPNDPTTVSLDIHHDFKIWQYLDVPGQKTLNLLQPWQNPTPILAGEENDYEEVVSYRYGLKWYLIDESTNTEQQVGGIIYKEEKISRHTATLELMGQLCGGETIDLIVNDAMLDGQQPISDPNTTATSFGSNTFRASKIALRLITFAAKTPGQSNYTSYPLTSLSNIHKLGRLYIRPMGTYKKFQSGEVAHGYLTDYAYDQYGNMVAERSVDEGLNEYIYDDEGKLRFYHKPTQTATTFNYINYDKWGRPIESGECRDIVCNPSSFTTSLYEFNENYYTSGTTNCTAYSLRNHLEGVSDNYCDEQNYIQYDRIESDEQTINGEQLAVGQFLSGTVAKTWNANNTSYYGYDYRGNTTRVLQKTQMATGNILESKIDYRYDPNNRLVQRAYNDFKHSTDKYVDTYEYDQSGRLKTQSNQYRNEAPQQLAKNHYYKHGAVKRAEIGDELQGLDFVYTITGALKSVNSPTLLLNNNELKDPGRDGFNNSTNSQFTQDIFGFTLDYYAGDYQRDDTHINFGDYSLAYNSANHYDGRIASVRWNTHGPNLAVGHNMYKYEYDWQGRLTAADFGTYTPNESVNSSGFNCEYTGTPDPNYLHCAGSFYERSGYKVANISYDLNGNIQSLERFGDDYSVDINDIFLDNLNYNYIPNTNRLRHVEDSFGFKDLGDVANQVTDNYEYNGNGEITWDKEKDNAFFYNTRNKTSRIESFGNGNKKVEYIYNERNERIAKLHYNPLGNVGKSTYYVRDEGGSILSIYEVNHTLSTTATHKEIPLPGVGVYYVENNTYIYQLTDHLGNVRATFKDNGSGSAETLSYSDYYPFGMKMPGRDQQSAEGYRFGYQGQELDSEVGGAGYYAFDLRMYDQRLGRWLAPDPYQQHWSPYLAMSNNPVSFVDPDGGWAYWASTGAGNTYFVDGIEVDSWEYDWEYQNLGLFNYERNLGEWSGVQIGRGGDIGRWYDIDGVIGTDGAVWHLQEALSIWATTGYSHEGAIEAGKNVSRTTASSNIIEEGDDILQTVLEVADYAAFGVVTFFGSASHAIITNHTLGFGRRDPSDAYFKNAAASGQFLGDLISVPLGVGEATFGAGVAGLGLATEVPSMGTSTVFVIGGSAIAAEGITTSTVALHNLVNDFGTFVQANRKSTPQLNNVNTGKRTGSASYKSKNANDGEHFFSKIIDNYASYATKFKLKGGDDVVRDLYQIEGSLRGKSGIFEWISKGGEVSHRRFIKGGVVNGIPNQRVPK